MDFVARELSAAVGRVASISIRPVSRFLGIMATARGDHDAAIAHLEDGLLTTERLGALPWHARGLRDLARALLARAARAGMPRGRATCSTSRGRSRRRWG
jgi:hypothetical protein